MDQCEKLAEKLKDKNDPWCLALTWGARHLASFIYEYRSLWSLYAKSMDLVAGIE